jgi:hypothetical protein
MFEDIGNRVCVGIVDDVLPCIGYAFSCVSASGSGRDLLPVSIGTSCD